MSNATGRPNGRLCRLTKRMRFRGAAARATLALVAVSGAGGAGSEAPETGPSVLAASPADSMSQFVAADLASGRTAFIELADSAKSPVLSARGRFLAFTEWVGDYPAITPHVIVRGMRGGSRQSVGEGWEPAWSPSGTRIAV